MSAALGSDGDAANRPAPPPLLLQMPLCPVCGQAVHKAPGGYECDVCRCSWLDDVDGLTEGEWLEPDAARCTVSCQPWADNIWVSDVRRAQVFRCVLDADHARYDATERGMHAHPEVTGAVFARGWQG